MNETDEDFECATCGKPCDVSDIHAGVVCRNTECPKAKEDGTCAST